MPIPVPFFFILTPFASFIFKSTITITDPAYFRQFWVVFWAIYHKFFHRFFFSTFITDIILMIINNLPRIFNFAAIFPDPQVLTCWLQGPPFFFWIFLNYTPYMILLAPPRCFFLSDQILIRPEVPCTWYILRAYFLIPLDPGKGQISWTKKWFKAPQATFFNDVFIACLCMCRLPRTTIEDKS